MITEPAAQEILRQWEAFGWCMLGALIAIIVAVLVLDELEKRDGKH